MRRFSFGNRIVSDNDSDDDDVVLLDVSHVLSLSYFILYSASSQLDISTTTSFNFLIDIALYLALVD